MSVVTGLYKLVGRSNAETRHAHQRSLDAYHAEAEERQKKEEDEKKRKEEEKQKIKEEKERLKAAKEKMKREEEKRKKKPSQGKERKAFNFEQVRAIHRVRRHDIYSVFQEKPQILTTIANASQASNNLVNAITVCIPVDSQSDCLISRGAACQHRTRQLAN